MQAQTYIPCDVLKPYISHLITQETAEESTYKVIPGTAIVLGFQYRGRLSLVKEGQENALAISGISGLADHYKIFRNSADIGTVLVFFRETGAASFFRQPLHELFKESLSLDHLMLRSELILLEEQLASATTDKKRIQYVEQFLISRMRTTEPDKMVLAALALIHRSKGDIRIRDLAGQLHTSQSPFEKRFRKTVGSSPKKFASIVRMKYVLQSSEQDSLTELGYEAGFYDQAHFIKEFRTFTGEAPEAFFKGKHHNDDW